MNTAVIYIHGKGGNAEEAEHYKEIFPKCDVIGFDYKAETPWEAMEEFGGFFDEIKKKYESVVLVANSIGAYLGMNALGDKEIEKAFFISPIVDLEPLIIDSDPLSMKYRSWVKEHPIVWKIPTFILYGSNDNLQTIDIIKAFAKKTNADITIMENGEHWFHTEEQMQFLDNWIKNKSTLL